MSRNLVLEIILPRRRPRPILLGSEQGAGQAGPLDYRRIALRLLLAALTPAIGAVGHLVATWLGY